MNSPMSSRNKEAPIDTTPHAILVKYTYRYDAAYATCPAVTTASYSASLPAIPGISLMSLSKALAVKEITSPMTAGEVMLAWMSVPPMYSLA